MGEEAGTGHALGNRPGRQLGGDHPLFLMLPAGVLLTGDLPHEERGGAVLQLLGDLLADLLHHLAARATPLVLGDLDDLTLSRQVTADPLYTAASARLVPARIDVGTLIVRCFVDEPGRILGPVEMQPHPLGTLAHAPARRVTPVETGSGRFAG